MDRVEFGVQYAALTSGVGLVDLSDRTQIEMTGADRAKFLHNLCTNAVRDLPAGGGCEAFLLNVKGHLVGHVFLFVGDRSIVLETVSGQNEKLLAHLDRYLIREDVTLNDRSGEWGELLVAGEKAEKLIADCGLPAVEGRLRHAKGSLAGHDVWVRRVDWVGPVGFLIAMRREAREAVAAALLTAGAVRCGSDVFETCRIEKGTPLYGQDISEEHLPQEVDRDSVAISFTKGCYLGQETVARIDALGHVNRLLRGVTFAAENVPAVGTEIFSGGKSVGSVTSACWSPRLNCPLGLAYVRRGSHEPGTKLEIGATTAEVIALPTT